MLARGLVYPLFVAQTTWFGMPDVCSAKGEWVEHGIEGHEVKVTGTIIGSLVARLGLQARPYENFRF